MAASKRTPTSRASKAELERSSALEVRRLQQGQQKLARKYKSAKKIEVTISPMYRPHFGKRMPVIINGIPIWVPCDGKSYKIPKQYARIVRARIKAVDDQVKRSKRLSNVSENFESYAGQRDLIGRA